MKFEMICSKNPKHNDGFYTTIILKKIWIVDKNGKFLAENPDDYALPEILEYPSEKNLWTCATCGCKAMPISYDRFPLKLDNIRKLGLSKGDIMQEIQFRYPKLVMDTALPQNWLDRFVSDSSIDYQDVLSTTFWVYPKTGIMGIPLSVSKEVNSKMAELTSIMEYKKIVRLCAEAK